MMMPPTWFKLLLLLALILGNMSSFNASLRLALAVAAAVIIVTIFAHFVTTGTGFYLWRLSHLGARNM